MIAVGIIVLLLASGSAVLAARVLLIWLNRPGEAGRRTSECLVLAGTSGSGADPATFAAVAASDDKGFRRLAVGRPETDAATKAAIEGLRRTFPLFGVADIVAPHSGRKVPESWFAAAAAAKAPGDPVMMLNSSARPSAPSIRALSIKVPEGWVCAGFPVRRTASGGWFSSGSHLSRLTPAMMGLYGPEGVFPGLVVARRGMFDSVVSDPLAVSRPSLGAAVLHAADPGSFVLADVPVPVTDSSFRLHMGILAYTGPLRFAALCCTLAAGPLSLVGTVASFLSGGGPVVLCETALFLSVVSRVVVAATWPSRAADVRTALIDALISPVCDAAALALALRSAFSPVVASGAQEWVIRRGGLLSPGRVLV